MGGCPLHRDLERRWPRLKHPNRSTPTSIFLVVDSFAQLPYSLSTVQHMSIPQEELLWAGTVTYAAGRFAIL